MSVKITGLVMDHVQGIKAVEFEIAETGLTTIGGKNRQGKSSILRMIAAALGGAKHIPDNPLNDDATEGWTELNLSNGITVKRSFVTVDGELKTRFKVTTSDGRGNQTLLKDFICEFALDLPAFLNAGDDKKAKILLDATGIDLEPYEKRIKEIYEKRQEIGRDKTKAEGHLKSLPYHPEVGTEKKKAIALTNRLEEIRQRNNVNADHRELLAKMRTDASSLVNDIANQEEHAIELEAELAAAREKLATLQENKATLVEQGLAQAELVASLEDLDPAPVQKELEEIDQHNGMVQHNLDYEKAKDELDEFTIQYTEKTSELAAARAEKKALLDGADFLPGLTIEDGLLFYQDKGWTAMSHADQIKVGIDIVSRINPEMGFVLVDKLEALDMDSLEDLDLFLHARNLQAIATRVSTGQECTLIIEEGRVQ